jgi:hypothetical protein
MVGNLPTGLSLNAATGAITGTPLGTGTFSFQVIATNIAGNSVPVNLSIQAGLALAIVTTSPLPAGTVGVAYTPLTFQAAGVDGSYAATWGWAAQSGSSLPAGITFTTAGVLSGTPSAAGTYNINVTVTNGSTNATSPFTIVVGVPPVITFSTELSGVEGDAFTVNLSASGTAPIVWTATGLPAWLTLSSGGTLGTVGTIGTVGYFSFTVTATNAYGSDSRQFEMIVMGGNGLLWKDKEVAGFVFGDKEVEGVCMGENKIFNL